MLCSVAAEASVAFALSTGLGSVEASGLELSLLEVSAAAVAALSVESPVLGADSVAVEDDADFADDES